MSFDVTRRAAARTIIALFAWLFVVVLLRKPFEFFEEYQPAV
jgi:hypothetical protein